MTDDTNSRKLKFTGSCKLSNAALAEIYHLTEEELSDEELASVGLERNSLIDDYRHLHEMWLLSQKAQAKPEPAKLKKSYDLIWVNQLIHRFMELNGSRGEAMDIVVNSLTKFHKKRDNTQN
ncbi:uncharacterized protein LOC115629750 [Scaptodrosophila lebanonensis]|uniref:Uncharacterized protein LOC115629750 n=1 Tax=Drosophila lebanonensis TaxID=7225 RepID=A0A6J2U1B7_DROLE|nr:uncharacterized protein LOC115629750 [Scaptodrosophila lebanonensis]